MKEGLSGQYLNGISLVVLGSASWSLTSIFIRLTEGPTWTIAFWRSFFQIVVLFVWLGWTLQGRFSCLFSPLRWPEVVSGVLVGGMLVLWVPAIRHTTVASALVLQGTAPIFAALFGWMILAERITKRTAIAIAGTVVGMLIMFGSDLVNGGIFGDALALTTAVFFGANVVLLRSTLGTGENVMRSILISGLIAGSPGVFTGEVLPVAMDDLFLCLLMGVTQTLGFILFNRGAQLIPAADTGLVIPVEAILGTLLAAIVVRELPAPVTLIGAAIVLGAVVVNIAGSILASGKRDRA